MAILVKYAQILGTEGEGTGSFGSARIHQRTFYALTIPWPDRNTSHVLPTIALEFTGGVV